MHSRNENLAGNSSITVICDEKSPFNRNLLALVKHWDRHGNINILPPHDEDSRQAADFEQHSLLAVDENGVKWNGAEAVPIIFKNLPFGRLAAAMYILPGTMWVTKQLYGTESAK